VNKVNRNNLRFQIKVLIFHAARPVAAFITLARSSLVLTGRYP
jgi:hypothetical protein